MITQFSTYLPTDEWKPNIISVKSVNSNNYIINYAIQVGTGTQKRHLHK